MTVAVRDLREARRALTLEREGFMLASHRGDYARRPEMLDTNLARAGRPAADQPGLL